MLPISQSLNQSHLWSFLCQINIFMRLRTRTIDTRTIKKAECQRIDAPHPWDFPGKSTGVGCHCLLQGIFPTQGWRSLVGCSPWGREELDTTERLHFHFSLSCIGEGNGNPLQCSCLENSRDGGAWWAAVYGVAQSRTRLKWLSSSKPLSESESEFVVICYWWKWKSLNCVLSGS